jgi:uncharacterized protein YlbG (UPF0298 family)
MKVASTNINTSLNTSELNSTVIQNEQPHVVKEVEASLNDTLKSGFKSMFRLVFKDEIV